MPIETESIKRFLGAPGLPFRSEFPSSSRSAPPVPSFNLRAIHVPFRIIRPDRRAKITRNALLGGPARFDGKYGTTFRNRTVTAASGWPHSMRIYNWKTRARRAKRALRNRFSGLSTTDTNYGPRKPFKRFGICIMRPALGDLRPTCFRRERRNQNGQRRRQR